MTGSIAQTPRTAQAEKIHIEEDYTKLWRKPVNDVRAHLVTTQDEFTLDHPTSLIMLFQNVGDQAMQLSGGVNVMSIVAMKGEQPDEPRWSATRACKAVARRADRLSTNQGQDLERCAIAWWRQKLIHNRPQSK